MSSLKGHRQVHHTLHRGGDRREHVHGGPPEDDGGGPGLQGVGVRLRGDGDTGKVVCRSVTPHLIKRGDRPCGRASPRGAVMQRCIISCLRWSHGGSPCFGTGLSCSVPLWEAALGPGGSSPQADALRILPPERECLKALVQSDAVYLGRRWSHAGEVPAGPAGGVLRHVHAGPTQSGPGCPRVQRLPLCVSGCRTSFERPRGRRPFRDPRLPSLGPQVHGASAQQELLHRFPLPRLHHAALLPAQQDCVRRCGGDHRGAVQGGQIASGGRGHFLRDPRIKLHFQAGVRRTEPCVIYGFSHRAAWSLKY